MAASVMARGRLPLWATVLLLATLSPDSPSSAPPADAAAGVDAALEAAQGDGPVPSPLPRGSTEGDRLEGIWMDPEKVASLPREGPAWRNLQEQAESPCPPPNLSDRDSTANTCVMAKALVYARTGRADVRAGVVDALAHLAASDGYRGRALALGRNLAAYALAADLVGIPEDFPALDALLRNRFRELREVETPGAASDLVDCHERRPNNWGTHCGASRAAVAAYLGDRQEMRRVARVFRGWLGDRSSYAGFTFGGPYGERDHSWECDPERPVGINPKGCTRQGHNIDGVLPDDQRRGGPFTWPPPRERYVWEALQGALVQAVILHRAGYDPFEWEDRALLRAVRWLHEEADFPADRGNTWQPHVINHHYGTSFPAPTPSRPGKNVGWTDWTHGPLRTTQR